MLSTKVIINDNNLTKTMHTWYFLPWKFFTTIFLNECFTLCSASMRTAQPETDRFFCRKLCKLSFHTRKVPFSKRKKFLFKGKSTQKTFNRRPVQIYWTIGRHTSYICLLLQTNFFLWSKWRRRKLLFKVSFFLLTKKEGKKQQDMFSVHLSSIWTGWR